MKKLLYTLLAVSIIFSACKKEDEEPTNSGNNNTGNNNTGNNTTSIVGKWDLKQHGHDRYLIYNNDTTVHDIVEISPIDWDVNVPFYHLEFLSNGEYIVTRFETFDPNEDIWEMVFLNGNWVLSNEIVYLSPDPDETSVGGYTITEVNNTNLTLSYHSTINTGEMTEWKEEYDVVQVYERIN